MDYNIPAYVIEPGIEIPEKHGNRWPLKDMRNGDSFLIPKSSPDYNKECRRLRVIAATYGKRWDWQFIVRSTPDGLRCWRTK